MRLLKAFGIALGFVAFLTGAGILLFGYMALMDKLFGPVGVFVGILALLVAVFTVAIYHTEGSETNEQL